MRFDGVKVFSATKARERSALGERITAWMKEGGADVVDVVVRQSSDNEFHCLSFVVFYREPGERCPHGERLGDCTACDVAGDLAYDADREDRRR